MSSCVTQPHENICFRWNKRIFSSAADVVTTFSLTHWVTALGGRSESTKHSMIRGFVCSSSGLPALCEQQVKVKQAVCVLGSGVSRSFHLVIPPPLSSTSRHIHATCFRLNSFPSFAELSVGFSWARRVFACFSAGVIFLLALLYLWL